MFRMICTLALGLCCSCDLFAQVPNIDSWKSSLLPPRNDLALGQTCSTVEGKLQTISREPADNVAQRGWIEHRLKKQQNDVQLWQEYLGLVKSSDPLWKPSNEKALSAIRKVLREKPNDPKLMLLQVQLLGDLDQEDKCREVLAELIQKHPQFVPGLIHNNGLTYEDKKYDESISYARELIRKYPQNADARVHLTSLLCKEIGRQLNRLFPNKAFDSSGRAFLSLQKEYQDLLNEHQEDAERKKTIQDIHSIIIRSVDEATQSIEQANQILAKDNKQQCDYVGILSYSLILEMCSAGLSGKNDSLEYRKILARKSKEMKAILAMALANKEDASLQTAAAFGIYAKMLLSISSEETYKEQVERFMNELTAETAKGISDLLKKQYPVDWADELNVIINLKRLAQTDYHPIAGVVEETLGEMSILIEADVISSKGYFQRALQHDPTRKNSYINYLGVCSLLKEKLSWDQLPASVREHQDTAEGHVVFVNALLNSDHPDEAVALRHISVALDHNPKYAPAILIKAGLLARKDPTEKTLNEAAALCEQGFELIYRDEQYPKIEVEYYLIAGTIDVLRGKSFSARRYFEDGLQLKPNDTQLKKAIDRMNGIVQVEGREKK